VVRALSEDEILSVLIRGQYGHLGCHAHGKTYVVPISFAWDGRRIVGMTTEGMKVLMMREDPFVCVQIDEVKDLAHWQSVIVWGKFTELSGVERAQAAGLLIDRYGTAFAEEGFDARSGRNVTPSRMDGKEKPVIVYAIEVEEKSGRAETD
jgi:nitroimidazol reductase NimA-like FMN-containing flavoprotein (pyridoxamine 5'-phosphate oxidase superfamily)